MDGKSAAHVFVIVVVGGYVIARAVKYTEHIVEQVSAGYFYKRSRDLNADIAPVLIANYILRPAGQRLCHLRTVYKFQLAVCDQAFKRKRYLELPCCKFYVICNSISRVGI